MAPANLFTSWKVVSACFSGSLDNVATILKYFKKAVAIKMFGDFSSKTETF